MKVKKELQKANDRINDQILEEGRDVYDKLMLENIFIEEKKERYTSSNIFRGKKLGWICSMLSVLIIVLSLSIVLSLVLKNNEPIQYLEDNQKTVDIAVDDINAVLATFQINTVDFKCECSKIYDEKYDDTLYYKINMISINNGVNGILYLAINKNYIFKERYNGNKIIETYKNNRLTYTRTLDDLDMLPINNFFGCLEIDDVKVYFEFSGFAEIFTTPALFLDQVLIVK